MTERLPGHYEENRGNAVNTGEHADTAARKLGKRRKAGNRGNITVTRRVYTWEPPWVWGNKPGRHRRVRKPHRSVGDQTTWGHHLREIRREKSTGNTTGETNQRETPRETAGDAHSERPRARNTPPNTGGNARGKARGETTPGINPSGQSRGRNLPRRWTM